jgi:hypothetical protein
MGRWGDVLPLVLRRLLPREGNFLELDHDWTKMFSRLRSTLPRP